MSETKVVGIVMATIFEARPIIKSLGFKSVGDRLYKLDRDGQGSVLLAISGIGPEPARLASYRLCDAGAKELISAGYCGALDPALRVGDLITDRIATSRVPVWKPADRLKLAEKANARAVDMETQAVIEAGTRRGVPIRVLRVISDQLGDDVSPLLGEEPTFSPLKIALRLWNPTRWPYLFKLWGQSRTASRRLVEAITSYLSSKS